MLSLNESAGETLSTRSPALEMSDIQATALRPRPKPYRGEYVILRIGNAAQGREMLRRIWMRSIVWRHSPRNFRARTIRLAQRLSKPRSLRRYIALTMHEAILRVRR